MKLFFLLLEFTNPDGLRVVYVLDGAIPQTHCEARLDDWETFKTDIPGAIVYCEESA